MAGKTKPYLAGLSFLLAAPLTACVHSAEDLPRPAVVCTSPDLGAPIGFTAALYFVTSRLADCTGPEPRFGRHRAKGSRFGYFPGPPDEAAPVLASQAAWLEGVRAHLAGSDGRVLLYVHGYNTSFDEASERAGRIAARAGFGGPVILFSWPSHGRVGRYTWDEENALWTQPHFDALLGRLLAEALVREVVVVAHSMGNRIALRSIAQLDRAKPELAGPKIRTIVLAAPDVDRAIFERDFLPSIARRGRSTTVYVSRLDRPLRGSWAVHGYVRAGDSGCDFLDVRRGRDRRRCFLSRRPPPAPPNIEVVETSLVSRSVLGHSDFVDSEAVATDLCRVLNGERVFHEREEAGAPLAHVSFVIVNEGAPPCPDPQRTQ